VFETRRPACRAWQEWAADTGTTTRDIPGSGQVDRRGEVTAVNLPFVSFRYTYIFRADGAVITSDSTLRFRGREELESSLAGQGYQVLEVRGAPDRPGHEFVFITQPTAAASSSVADGLSSATSRWHSSQVCRCAWKRSDSSGSRAPSAHPAMSVCAMSGSAIEAPLSQCGLQRPQPVIHPGFDRPYWQAEPLRDL